MLDTCRRPELVRAEAELPSTAIAPPHPGLQLG